MGKSTTINGRPLKPATLMMGHGFDPTLSEGKLKNLLGTLIVPPMTGSLRRFVDWVAAYTMAPPGAVLRMAMSVPSALDPPGQQAGWRLSAAGEAARWWAPAPSCSG